jgi:cytidine deaminase
MKLNLTKATKIAISAASQSKERHKMGAIIFTKSKYVTGFNKTFSVKVQNRDTKYSEHAEAMVINRAIHSGIDLKQSTLIIIRINNSGNQMLARPCKYCTRLIKKMKIPTVYYSSDPLHRELSPQNFKSLL